MLRVIQAEVSSCGVRSTWRLYFGMRQLDLDGVSIRTEKEHPERGHRTE